MSRKVIHIAVLSIVTVGLAFGLRYWIRSTWTCAVLKTQLLPGNVKISDLQFSSGSHSFTAMVIRIPHDAYKARLIDLDPGETLGSHLTADRSKLVINAGYFDASNNPLGLIRVNGVERGKLLEQTPLTGIVTIDARGAIRLIPRGSSDEIKSDVDAFQAGPFLIDPGGKMGIHSDDGISAERTVLAYNRNCIEIIITTPVTLYQLADCIHRNPEDFDLYQIGIALNLDGGPSTSYAIHVAGKTSGLEPRKPIRNAIVFDLRQ